MRTKSRTEESLLEMLMYAKIPSLPEPNDKEQIWVRAIVKILRKSGHMDYAIAYHDFFAWNEINVTKELPGLGVAHELVEIYPYEYLKEESIPDVSNKKEIISFISSRMPEDEEYLSGMSNDNLKKHLFNICIKEQINRTNMSNNFKNYRRKPIDIISDIKTEEEVETKTEELKNEKDGDNGESGNGEDSGERSNAENKQGTHRGRKSKVEK